MHKPPIDQSEPRPRVLVASTNPHKVAEIAAIFAPLGIEAVGLGEVEGARDIPEPEESGATFAENARIKAIAYAKATRMVCVADDSGLEVDALGGRPGIFSARYAGVGDTRVERDHQNTLKLLEEMEVVPREKRGARYVCEMCVASPTGEVIAKARGTMEGRIGEVALGEGGFGYDPVFVLDDGRTAAQLSPEEKNARSHRGAACRALAPRLAQLLRME